ncbi:PspC domain-containing protein [Modestobacter sp. SYSU DS0290]
MTSALPPSAPPPTADQPPGSWPPPPQPGAAPRPQLRRSRTDRVIGGVAGGLADYTGVDALLWRVGAIALTLAGGSGIVIYLLLWLLMPAAPAVQPGEQTPRPPSGPRSPVPGVTVAVLLIVLGIGVLLTRFTDLDIGARGFLGSALLVVGVGLVVGALTGAGRGAKGGLITLGLLLSAALLVASTVQLPDGEMGDRTYRPMTAAAVQSEYEHGAGDFTLDLSELDLADGDRTIRTSVDSGLGDVQVLVPFSADVQVSVDNAIGDVELFGDALESGFFPGYGADWSDDDDPEIVLTISLGAGSVEVSRG